MKKVDLGQMVGVLANLGVLAGILLLAYELNQNRMATQSQTRNAIADTLVELLSLEATTPELMELESKKAAGEPLTRAEFRMDDRMTSAYWRWRENVHYQYRNGLYEDSEYAVQRTVWSRSLNSDAADRDRWCSRRDTFSEDFRREIDGMLDEPCS